MFAQKPRKEYVTRMVLIAALLLTALSPTAALAETSAAQVEEPTQTVTETPTAVSTASQPGTEAPRALSTPTPSDLSTPVRGTQTPTPSIATTPEGNREEAPSLVLYSDLDSITPDAMLTITWEVGGVSHEEQGLRLEIQLPEGFLLEDGYEGIFDETTFILNLPVNSLSGKIRLRNADAVGDAYFGAVLYN